MAATRYDGRVEERSLPELVSTMGQDVTTLIRQEMELAREELKVEARKAGKAGAGLGAGAVLGHLAGVGAVLALGFLLDEVMPTWLGFLIVTTVLAIAAVVLLQRGRDQLRQVDPVPDKTIDTLKEDRQWLSEQRS